MLGSDGIVGQKYELVDVDSIQPHKDNVNEGDCGVIVQSIEANGFFGAVVIQESTRNILCGKHRWLAARSRGLEKVPAIIVDVDDATALRIMLVDNRSARLGMDNEPALAALLERIQDDTGSLMGTGFTGDDLDELLANMTGGTPESDSTDESNSASGPVSVTCPQCGNHFTPA